MQDITTQEAIKRLEQQFGSREGDLPVSDECTRESLEIDIQGSIRSGRVIELLSRLTSVHGAPRYLRSDNGPEFVSRAVLKSLHKAGIDTALIDPGKPWQNCSDEGSSSEFSACRASLSMRESRGR
jgi:hypothetical protein